MIIIKYHNSFSFLAAPWHTVPGPGVRQIQAAVVIHAAAVATPDPLTYCAGPGIEPESWRSREATVGTPQISLFLQKISALPQE